MDKSKRSTPKAFIFEKQYKKLLVSKEIQEKHGHLYGYWTHEYESVICVITGSENCVNGLDRALSLMDFSHSSPPLEHIGNWRCSDVGYVKPCNHEKRSDDFLFMFIDGPNIGIYSADFKKSYEIVIFDNKSLPWDVQPTKPKKEHQKELANSPKQDQSKDFHTGNLANTKRDMLSGDTQECYIFREDYDLLIGKLTQEWRGNLFGLWTTNDEAVIHVISGPNCCSQKGSNSVDIMGKSFPLAHMGNWRYNGYQSTLRQTGAGSDDTSECPHKYKQKFFDVIVSRSEPFFSVRSRDGKNRKIKVLEDRSPFRLAEAFKEMVIKGKKEDLDSSLEEIKHLSLEKCKPEVPREKLSPEEKCENIVRQRDMSQLNKVWSRNGSTYLDTLIYRSEFTVNREDFKVFIFEEDYQIMANLVLKYPNLETGGDLFGLWTTSGNAMLHVVLGPGQHCRRTGASFYQDVSYLKENGDLLTQDYMLCHIGEWHSHHQLSLFQPSGGDSSTVISNYPRGFCGFILIIANILPSRQVQLSPYLYTQFSRHGFDQKGTIEILHTPNLFKTIWRVKKCVESGEEKYSYSRPEVYHDLDYKIGCQPELRRHMSQAGKRRTKSLGDTTIHTQNPYNRRRQAPKSLYGTSLNPPYRNFQLYSSSRVIQAKQSKPPWK